MNQTDKILAVDTTTLTCSVTLWSMNSPTIGITHTSRETHAKHLMVLVDQVLHLGRCDLDSVGAFVVTLGPGTFTGLRIGISTVKGFGMATGKPVVGLSSLETLAAQAMLDPLPVCPMIDAKRGEVYHALYQKQSTGRKLMREEMVSDIDAVIAQVTTQTLFVGSGALAYKDVLKSKLGSLAVLAPSEQHTISSATLARLGYERLIQGHSVQPESLAPIYIRKSDAEINLEKKATPY